MSPWIELALIAGGMVLLAIALQAFFRPRYMLSVQKTTNSASQPEVVSLQANLPWWASGECIWTVLETKLALPATSRMVTVNEMILDANRELSEKIAAERPELKSKFLRKLDKRRRKYAAKRLGIPVDKVTDEHIKQLVGQGGMAAQPAEDDGAS